MQAMTFSNATYWCPACDRVGACKNKWSHEKTKLHHRSTERKCPRPDLPSVDPLTLVRAINFARGKPAHSGYLETPSKR